MVVWQFPHAILHAWFVVGFDYFCHGFTWLQVLIVELHVGSTVCHYFYLTQRNLLGGRILAGSAINAGFGQVT